MIILRLGDKIPDDKKEFYHKAGYELNQIYEFSVNINSVKTLGEDTCKKIEELFGLVSFIIMLHNGTGQPLIYCTIEHLLTDWTVVEIEDSVRIVPK